MAKNRKDQSAAIRFGPALVASFSCLVIAGAAVGYVWQKGEIYRLGRQIHDKESRLMQLQSDDKRLTDQLALLRSPVTLDRRAQELRLGLAPAQPMQVFRLTEPSVVPLENKNSPRQFAKRPMDGMTP
jgi:hypothetical protein